MLDLNAPLGAREILARCERNGERISDTAERLIALATVLVKDLDFETRAELAFYLRSHADFLTGVVVTNN